MREQAARSFVLAGVALATFGLVGCGGATENQSGAMDEKSASSGQKEPGDTGSSESAGAKADTKVESIDVMVERLLSKSYSCEEWKRTDDVDGASASGTCNGTDQLMWFESAEAVEEQAKKLGDAGTGYVIGDNWIVANTKTPTLVRNALKGTAVPAK